MEPRDRGGAPSGAGASTGTGASARTRQAFLVAVRPVPAHDIRDLFRPPVLAAFAAVCLVFASTIAVLAGSGDDHTANARAGLGMIRRRGEWPYVPEAVPADEASASPAGEAPDDDLAGESPTILGMLRPDVPVDPTAPRPAERGHAFPAAPVAPRPGVPSAPPSTVHAPRPSTSWRPPPSAPPPTTAPPAPDRPRSHAPGADRGQARRPTASPPAVRPQPPGTSPRPAPPRRSWAPGTTRGRARPHPEWNRKPAPPPARDPGDGGSGDRSRPRAHGDRHDPGTGGHHDNRDRAETHDGLAPEPDLDWSDDVERRVDDHVDAIEQDIDDVEREIEEFVDDIEGAFGD